MASTLCTALRQSSVMLVKQPISRSMVPTQQSLVTACTANSQQPRVTSALTRRGFASTAPTHARSNGRQVQPAPKLAAVLDAATTPTFTPTAMGRSLLETLELEEMYHRKQQRGFPEFRSGSVLRVTYQEARSRPSLRRLVGIVVSKVNRGLASHFTLRNVMEGMAFEKNFSLFGPLVHSIEVLDLARRRKSKLYYLDDKPLKASTVSQKYAPPRPLRPGFDIQDNHTDLKRTRANAADGDGTAGADAGGCVAPGCHSHRRIRCHRQL
eukprot:m.386894 g.386894  ORF g.386894 m.386894 type:complete len:268 (+) comp21026_c0_seq4:262-1065(+)